MTTLPGQCLWWRSGRGIAELVPALLLNTHIYTHKQTHIHTFKFKDSIFNFSLFSDSQNHSNDRKLLIFDRENCYLK